MSASAHLSEVVMQKRFLVAPVLLSIVLTTAATTFTDAAVVSYNPATQSLSVEPGASTYFNQSITSPSGSYFWVSLMVVGTGATPIPASWVSVSPTSMGYFGIMTNTWRVTIAPPSETVAGVYTAAIKGKPSDSNFGEGSGTEVTLTVGTPVPAMPTSWGRIKAMYR
jgi:hypothetical protein